MKLAFETFVCGVLISLLVLLGMYTQQVNIDTGNAKQFCSSVVNRMEGAEFANEIVDQCKSEANAAGYQLTMTPTSSNGNFTTYTVDISYKTEVPLFKFKKQYHIKQTVEIENDF